MHDLLVVLAARLARISHQPSAAAAEGAESARPSPSALLDVLQVRLRRAPVRGPRISSTFDTLATKSGENCGLALVALFVLSTGCSSDPRSGKSGARPEPQGKAGQLTAVLSALKDPGKGLVVKDSGGWKAQRVGHSLAFGSSVRTEQGARARIALADGTALHLNEGTTVALLDRRRLALEQGELLAEVATVVGEPMTIETAGARVKVFGTRLNVAVEGDQTTVDVVRGTVEVHGAGAQVEIGAGERAVARKGSAPRVEVSRDLVQVTGWAREMVPPKPSVRALERGFGSLTARVPGQHKSRALSLARHQVNVVVRDNIARTEIEQSYYNASNQTLEGTYRFPLPAGASISRLALWVGDRLEEGEIVERYRARRIFRQIVEDTIRPRDPALLEWVGGRTFQMKIFPIPPRSSRRVILAYTQPLQASFGRYQYVYPMSTSHGKATRIARFGVNLRVNHSRGLGRVDAPLYPVLTEKQGGETRLSYEASDFVPAASFVVNYAPADEAPELQLAVFEPEVTQRRGTCALRHPRRRRTTAPSRVPRWQKIAVCGDRGGFFMATLRPQLPMARQAKHRDLLFVLDSSHGTAKQAWELQKAALAAFLGEMDLRTKFNVLACDARCRKLGDAFARPTAEARKAALDFVAKLEPGGSSDLQGAFDEAAQLAADGKDVQVLYLGDGRPSAGELREPELARLVVTRLRKARATLSALQIGEDVAELFLAEATRRLGGRVYRLETGDDVAARVFEVVASQYRNTLTDIEVHFEGVDAHSVYPQQVPSIAAGGEVLLVGRYDQGGQGAVRVRGLVDGQPFERRYPLALAAESAERRANRFIPRLWAQHHLDALSLADHRANRPEIVRMSKAYTVLSRATAFLVLENERMYREFRVKRTRRRDYWKGGDIAVRSGAGQPTTVKADTEDEAKAEVAASPLGSTGTGAGQAAGKGAGSVVSPDKASLGRRKRSASAPRLRRRSKARDDLDDLIDRPREKRSSPTRHSQQLERAQEPAVAAPSEAGPADAPPQRVSGVVSKLPANRSMRGDRRPYPRYVAHRLPRYELRWATSVKIDPLLQVEPTDAGLQREQRLGDRVAGDPLRRSLRRAYQRQLVRNGSYRVALDHAVKWVELEGQRPEPLLALADMQAATASTPLAMRTYSAMAEVWPWSARIHRQLAQMYRNKGDMRRSCAHHWSILSLAPKRIERHLELARCLATAGERDEALRILTEAASARVGRKRARQIEKLVEQVQTGQLAVRSARKRRGGLEVSATWNQPVDLDLVLVTPRGERISAVQGNRRGGIELDSHDGQTAELLRVRSTPNGSYRVEIARGNGSSDKPVSGTALIRVHGKSQVVPFTLDGHSRPLARLSIHRRQVRRRIR